jgi:hypothetical protein
MTKHAKRGLGHYARTIEPTPRLNVKPRGPRILSMGLLSDRHSAIPERHFRVLVPSARLAF